MFSFTDLSKQPNQNMIYIDLIELIPYKTLFPNRILYIFDTCNVATSYELEFKNEGLVFFFLHIHVNFLFLPFSFTLLFVCFFTFTIYFTLILFTVTYSKIFF
jgi:hypothetical protein